MAGRRAPMPFFQISAWNRVEWSPSRQFARQSRGICISCILRRKPHVPKSLKNWHNCRPHSRRALCRSCCRSSLRLARDVSQTNEGRPESRPSGAW